MDKQVDDIAYMLIRLKDKGINLVIITGRSMALKGKGNLQDYENMDGIPIHRLYTDGQDMFLFPGKAFKKVLQIAHDFKPDCIFCAQELNMRLAILIKKKLNKPIVLLVEYAGRISSGESYNSYKVKSAMRFFGIPTGSKFWDWLCNESDILITCSPRDQRNLTSLSRFNKPVYHVPWPSHIPINLDLTLEREKGRGIYVGSLYPFKNTQEFEKTLPLILEKTKTKQFVVVGTGTTLPIIKKLEQKYGKAICHIDRLPRNEALKLIASSYYAYSPVKLGGWGFIGDCWSMRTPIVMTHNDDYVINEENALVSEGFDDLIRNINRLYDDAETMKKLGTNGYKEYEKRKANVVGDQIFDIFQKHA